MPLRSVQAALIALPLSSEIKGDSPENSITRPSVDAPSNYISILVNTTVKIVVAISTTTVGNWVRDIFERKIKEKLA